LSRTTIAVARLRLVRHLGGLNLLRIWVTNLWRVHSLLVRRRVLALSREIIAFGSFGSLDLRIDDHVSGRAQRLVLWLWRGSGIWLEGWH